jgi:hypothetical protein
MLCASPRSRGLCGRHTHREGRRRARACPAPEQHQLRRSPGRVARRERVVGARRRHVSDAAAWQPAQRLAVQLERVVAELATRAPARAAEEQCAHAHLTRHPARLLTSPSKLLTSPSELLASPSELLTSPSELSASPSELLASPSELSASPSELLTSPSEALSVTQRALNVTQRGSSPHPASSQRHTAR